MNSFDRGNFRDSIKKCTDRTLLDWLEKENIALKTIFLERQQSMSEMIMEIKKRMKIDDFQGIRTEQWNPELQKWEEKPL